MRNRYIPDRYEPTKAEREASFTQWLCMARDGAVMTTDAETLAKRHRLKVDDIALRLEAERNRRRHHNSISH